MLTISDVQVKKLAEPLEEQFLQHVAQSVRTDFPAEFAMVTERELASHIRPAYGRFRRFGFRQKEHLYRLVVLELLYGPNFELDLAKECRAVAFETHVSDQSDEAERFWTVYRHADALPQEKRRQPMSSFPEQMP